MPTIQKDATRFPALNSVSRSSTGEQKSYQTGTRTLVKESIDGAKYLREERSGWGSNERTKESQSVGCCSLQLDKKC